MPFLPPNQQHQSTEGSHIHINNIYILACISIAFTDHEALCSGSVKQVVIPLEVDEERIAVEIFIIAATLIHHSVTHTDTTHSTGHHIVQRNV